MNTNIKHKNSNFITVTGRSDRVGMDKLGEKDYFYTLKRFIGSQSNSLGAILILHYSLLL